MVPALLQSTEPLIKDDLNDTNIPMPFRGFNKDTYPSVNTKL